MFTGIGSSARPAAAERAASAPPAAAFRRPRLDVQVLHVERVLLDEVAARLDVVAHQRGEDVVGLDPSSIFTCSSVRRIGFIVVSASWSGFISPRPL